MAQVFIGQVENLEDLMRGLASVRESLESACRDQIAAAKRQREEARTETRNSEKMLEQAGQAECESQQAVVEAQQELASAEHALGAAESALSVCKAQPQDEEGYGPDCGGEEADVAEAQLAVQEAEANVAESQVAMEKAVANRQRMERRVECAKQALGMAEQVFEETQQACAAHMREVYGAMDVGKARLVAAHRALEGYLATNLPAAEFHGWLHWCPERGKSITPEVIRGRMNVSKDQQPFLHQYLYDRKASYRNLVDKYRGEWASANGDVERDIINRRVRTHLSGEYAEQMARYALAPLGGQIDTQGRTFVGDNGRYTKTDLIVRNLRVPVVLGRGEGMGASVGGSMAFEVKCGKSEYLYSQKDHMLFQAEGHKHTDAHCTLCSRDIHDLPPEKEEELREALRAGGSPMVGMLPRKNDIDHSCLAFIRQGKEDVG